MPVSENELTQRLLNKILFASSQQEVKESIAAAVKTLEQNNSDEDKVAHFVDAVNYELYQFNAMVNDAREWSNIKMARIVVNRMKYHWDTVV